MRKSFKEQAEKFITLLRQAHEEIKKALYAKNRSLALDLLEQCQEGTIELGNAIEASEGESVPVISLMEAYCEQVYQLYEKLRQDQYVNTGNVCESLNQSAGQMEECLHNIPVRTEVVFLPYKASMWDSLESIWKAAEEDPDCDAYVIPIPYFDKNPDGTFREMHYEGDQYPEDVPITHYQDYDFQERHPELIFIHNPYDECNYVTSVHPFFYSQNLKQYTEKLVYVPYFILGEPDPEDAACVESIAHFCTCPGVIHADRVIVQSEAMKKVYVKVLTAYAKEAGAIDMDQAYWEERILGLGSPKVDKVLNTKREDLKIPQEWLRVIEKPDGSWKKIIFYNTTVTAFLKHGEQYLKKMKDVFRIFYENREEVALLWRPHPLMKATVESMRPKLWGEYEKIVEEYRGAKWGIYDDTADLNRAVAVCDGYYGDHSSVVKLYQHIKKPIMIQNCEIIFGI